MSRASSPSCVGYWTCPRSTCGRRRVTKRTPGTRRPSARAFFRLGSSSRTTSPRPAIRSGGVAGWCDGTISTEAASATKRANASRSSRYGSSAAAVAAISTIWTGAASSIRAAGRVSDRSGSRNAGPARTSAIPSASAAAARNARFMRLRVPVPARSVTARASGRGSGNLRGKPAASPIACSCARRATRTSRRR